MILIFDEARSPNIYYQCGWDSDVRCLYREEDGEKILYVPGFEYHRAKKEVSADVQVKELKDPLELIKSFTGSFTIPGNFPYTLGKELSGDVEWKKVLYPERAIKNENEIAAIKHAQDMARHAIEAVITALEEHPHTTVEQLKLLARTTLIEAGYDCPDLIISSGEQTAQPHNRGSGKIVPGPVIIDIYPRSAKTFYHGDMTRTVIVGKHPEAEKMLAAVQDVQERCIKRCTPGTKAAELYQFAIEELAKHGFATTDDTGMIHSLGHGLGLAVHEGCSLGPKDETVLEEGMVITIEPGLYYDVGVRWEDVVVVGKEPRIL